MSTPTDYQIVTAMLTYGGSFVKALAAAFRAADATNQARLKAAFPEIVEQYRELAQMQHARSER